MLASITCQERESKTQSQDAGYPAVGNLSPVLNNVNIMYSMHQSLSQLCNWNQPLSCNV
jgi:hypothetical protein